MRRKDEPTAKTKNPASAGFFLSRSDLLAVSSRGPVRVELNGSGLDQHRARLVEDDDLQRVLHVVGTGRFLPVGFGDAELGRAEPAGKRPAVEPRLDPVAAGSPQSRLQLHADVEGAGVGVDRTAVFRR